MTQPVLATGAGHNPIDQAGDRTMESVASTGRVDQARTYGQGLRTAPQKLEDATVKGGVIMDRRGGCERSGVALQNWTTRRLL